MHQASKRHAVEKSIDFYGKGMTPWRAPSNVADTWRHWMTLTVAAGGPDLERNRIAPFWVETF